MTDYPTVPSGAIDAIVYGYHGDPFSILGAHAVENGTVIRAFMPTIREVKVVWPDQSISESMVRSHDSGFFELLVWDRQPPTDYQFQVTTYNSYSWLPKPLRSSMTISSPLPNYSVKGMQTNYGPLKNLSWKLQILTKQMIL